jgi:hypothetical protein
MEEVVSEEKEEARRVKLAQLGSKLHWLQVTTVKLGGDFLFCGKDPLPFSGQLFILTLCSFWLLTLIVIVIFSFLCGF